MNIKINSILIILTFILLANVALSQSKPEFIVHKPTMGWQNLKKTDCQVETIKNQSITYQLKNTIYNYGKNIYKKNEVKENLNKTIETQNSDWSKITGPEGGSVRSIFKYFDSLYLITDREAYILKEDKWIPLNYENYLCNTLNCLFVYKSGRILLASDWGLASSDDEGATWTHYGGQLNGATISDITKLNEDSVLLSTSNGIFVNEINNDKFTLLDSNLKNILTLTFENEGKIWAGTSHGVYKADYPALNWKRVNLDTSYYPKILINKRGTIYTHDAYNICKSTDTGESWQYISGSYFPDICLEGDSDLIITTNQFIFKANEEGIYWSSAETDMFLQTTFLLNNDEFLVGTLGAGVFKYNTLTSNFGEFNSGIQSATFRAIEILKDGTIFTVTDANKYYLSHDDGQTWKTIRNGWTRCTKQDEFGNLYVAEGTGLIKSTDYGANWINLPVYEEPFYINAMDISEDGNIICVGYSAGDVYLSTNRGNSFKKIFHRNYYFIESVIILENNTVLFQCDSLYYTQDNGKTLNSVKENKFFASTFIQDDDGFIFMGSYGIYRSKDGIHWIYLSSNHAGAPQYFDLDSLNNLYSIFQNGMVMKSQNKGTSWESVMGGLTNSYIWSFDMNEAGIAYCGTQDKGLFRSRIVIERHEEKPTNYSLKNNYPNPFNFLTRIEYEVPIYSNINISIYDILGNKVETLINEMKDPGEYAIDWNAYKFSSGVYFAVMNVVGRFTQVQKLIYLK